MTNENPVIEHIWATHATQNVFFQAVISSYQVTTFQCGLMPRLQPVLESSTCRDNEHDEDKTKSLPLDARKLIREFHDLSVLSYPLRIVVSP